MTRCMQQAQPYQGSLRDALAASGLTQEKLARRTGLSLATVNRAIRTNCLPVKRSGAFRKALGLPDEVKS